MSTNTLYDTFIWKGQTRYRCNRRWDSGTPCEYDTHDLNDMAKHAAQPHLRLATAGAPEAAAFSPSDEKPAPEFRDARFADVERDSESKI